MPKRILSVLIVLAMGAAAGLGLRDSRVLDELAPVVHAEVGVFNGTGTGIAVSNTAATTDLGALRSSLSITNCGSDCTAPSTSGQLVYARVFWCGETVTAATVATGIPISPGATVAFSFNPRTENIASRAGYCKISFITASSTAAVTVIAK